MRAYGNLARLFADPLVDEREQEHAHDKEGRDRKNRRTLTARGSRDRAEDERAEESKRLAGDAEEAEKFRRVLLWRK